MPQAEAILVWDGWITACSGHEAAFAAKDSGYTRIDLGAGPILTGFLDGHSHIVGLSASLFQTIWPG